MSLVGMHLAESELKAKVYRHSRDVDDIDSVTNTDFCAHWAQVEQAGIASSFTVAAVDRCVLFFPVQEVYFEVNVYDKDHFADHVSTIMCFPNCF